MKAMSEERKKILEMLQAGIITVAEAERLLAAVEPGSYRAETSAASAPESEKAPGKRPKYFRVALDSSEGDQVDVRLPLQLIRAGMKFKSLMAFIPEQARDRIAKEFGEKGMDVDLTRATGENVEEFIDALADMDINVNSGKGDKVRVFTE